MADQDFQEGYPSSAPEDLVPGLDEIEDLDWADEEAEAEQRVHEGQAPDGSVDDEDRLDDAHDADELADAEMADPRRRVTNRPDRANFGDNAAAWSRAES